MQYSVPQFIEIEDKIIGPLTLKQFLILVAGALFCFFYWSIFGGPSVFFFILAIPTMGFFAIIAFAKFNGRPLMSNIAGLYKFYTTPRFRVFLMTGEKPLTMLKKQAESPKPERPDAAVVGSRLHKLAYLLDQKTAEEERLIHVGKGKERWLNQI